MSGSVAVIVVSYNVRELLRACLASVVRCQVSGIRQKATEDLTPDSCSLIPEVVVIDNASADGSAEMVAAEFPQVRLIASPTNLGFAGGNNLALRALGLGGVGEQEGRERDSQPRLSTPQYVLLLNPDAEPAGDAIGQMAQFLIGHPAVGGVGAQLRYPDGRFQHGAFRFPGLLQLWFDLFPPRPRRLLDSRLNGRYPRRLYAARRSGGGGQPFPIDFALGAALMVRREAIQAAGLMDEGYFMYAEEVDWCWRIQRAGWPLYCVPSALVVHHGGASTSQFRSQSFLNLWRSRRRLYGRFYGPVRRRVAGWVVRMGMRAEVRRAEAAARRGQMGAQEAAERIAAARQVAGWFA